MSLVADYSGSDSSTDSEELDKATSNYQTKSGKNIKLSLPSANEMFSSKTGEVLRNRFQQEELANTASLERHVKMVGNDDRAKMKNGRKICWNYRRGKCRFGSKCQFAHDSDLNIELNVDKNVIETNKMDLSKTASGTKKRKHPGLSDNIIPSKRVIKTFNQQKRPT